MIVKLLTEHPLEFLGLKRGCRGLSEPTLVKISNCWKSRVANQLCFTISRIYGKDLFMPISPPVAKAADRFKSGFCCYKVHVFDCCCYIVNPCRMHPLEQSAILVPCT